MAKAKKAPVKKISEAKSKSTVRHPDTQKLEDLSAHIQERIADGGATTDHLKNMLTMINPEGLPGDETQNLTV